MRTVFLALALTSVGLAEDHFILFRSGPFEVYSATGEKVPRERLNDLEQFREALGYVLGKKDLKLIWPLRLVITKKAPALDGGIALGRDAYMSGLGENEPLSTGFRKQLAELLIDENTNRFPTSIENGLLQLFSTLEVNGTHITIGIPPENKSRDWARMQLLTVNDAYSGRTRVMLSNLEQSNDMVAACRNAFEKNPDQIEKQVDDYVKAGNFPTGSVPGRAISPQRDFHPREVAADTGKLLLADLLLAAGQTAQAEAAYGALHGPEASEGLGLVALKNGKKDEAARLFKSAIDSGSKNARAYVEIGTQPELRRAMELNPSWGEPDFRMARRVAEPPVKLEFYKKATALEPRNIEYWKELAQTAQKADLFPEAAKAWAGAERAAATDDEREKIHAARQEIESQRADYEEAERKRKAAAEAADLKRVQDQSMAEIHAAEQAINKKLNPTGAPIPKDAVWMDEVNGTGKADGMLQKVECNGPQAKLVVQGEDGKTTTLLVKDGKQLAVLGADAKAFACGPQNPARHVTVQYVVKEDKKRGTAGEATIIEYH
ncbi:MAG TPA: hypothetical protein VKU01_33845 [Bryobacteraceae bacterium]|nr:hypothetical protein [Bryobacteraceae bacterium]